jgi:hypothetical protein
MCGLVLHNMILFYQEYASEFMLLQFRSTWTLGCGEKEELQYFAGELSEVSQVS